MRLLFLALVCTSCAAAPRAPTNATAPSVAWTVSVGRDLRLVEHICWQDFVPDRVVPESERGVPFARIVRRSPGCIDVVVDLGAMARELQDETLLRTAGDVVYGSFDPWLWRPEPWPKGMVGRLRLELPDGIGASLPNERAASGEWLVPFSTWSFMARVAIGPLTVDTITAAGAAIAITRLPGAAPGISAEGARRFVMEAASAVASLDGRMPTDRVQLLLGPGSARNDDPVQFGMAMRGAGPGVVLRVAPSATDASIRGEWVTVHELSHLWLPPVDSDDAWFSEGFASYYQNIVRSRAGTYSEAEAWAELLAGFDRGRAQAGALPLREAHSPRFQQIYWGGAAVWLALDVELRAHGASLDAVVARLRRASPDNGGPMARLDERPALELLALLEQGTGRDLRGIAGRALAAPFPDVGPTLAALGIRQTGDGLVLDEAAPQAAVRRAIAARR